MSLTTLERRGAVALLTMNHRDENRFNLPFVEELLARLAEVAADSGLRGLVVTGGHEKYFSNGLDLEWMAKQDLETNRHFLFRFNDLFRTCLLFPKPLVTAINGHAFAGGAIWMCAFDFRIMRQDRGWICYPEVELGIPFLPGMIALVERVIGPGRAGDIFLTGKRLTAPEALALELIHRAVPKAEVVPQALALADELGKKSLGTYAEIKRRSRRGLVQVIENVDPGYISGMSRAGK